MLINQSSVRRFVHSRGKRIDKSGLIIFERAVERTLDRAVQLSGGFKTIRDTEIAYSLIKEGP